MLLISFWQVLMVFIAFLSLKQAKNEGELGIVHGKASLKLNYMKNPSFGEFWSLFQINQVCKEENQRMNLTLKNFATPCEIFTSPKEYRKACKTEEFRNPFLALRNFSQARRNFATPFQSCKIFATLRNLPVIFRYFCTDSIRFLSQDILCNYLLSPCNKLRIFLDI